VVTDRVVIFGLRNIGLGVSNLTAATTYFKGRTAKIRTMEAFVYLPTVPRQFVAARDHKVVLLISCNHNITFPRIRSQIPGIRTRSEAEYFLPWPYFLNDTLRIFLLALLLLGIQYLTLPPFETEFPTEQSEICPTISALWIITPRR
jgi:hypothetical protein